MRRPHTVHAPAAPLALSASLRLPLRILRQALVALLVLPLLAAPFIGAVAGASTVLVSDPAGDQVVTAGPLAVPPPALAQADLRLVAFDQPDTSSLQLTFTTTAAPDARTSFSLSFRVAHGATSLASSTASGTTYNATFGNGSVTGLAGATLKSAGATTTLLVPLSAIGAVGGDQLEDLLVTSRADSDGGTPDPVTQDDAFATDRAPDAGTANPVVLARPPMSGDIALALRSHTVRCAGMATPPSPIPAGCDATVELVLAVTNQGIDDDSVRFASPDAAVDASPLAVSAGQTSTATLALHPGKLAAGNRTLTVTAESSLGGRSTTSLTLTAVPVATPPAERHPSPAGLKFLTPVVEALGFDEALGDYAELGFLLLVTLLAVVLIFLALSVQRSPWVRAKVTPTHAIAAPGGVAEFHIQLQNAKAKVREASAVLKAAGAWGATLVRKGEGAASRIRLPGPGSDGYLRVRVPTDARPKERETVDLDIVPVDADGRERPERAQHTRITVQASVPTHAGAQGAVTGRDIRLASVRHEPAHPVPGATVTTTATIQNQAAIPALLRVVLLLDGHAVGEQRTEVAARGEQAVALAWTAGSGRNQVKVQVFLA